MRTQEEINRQVEGLKKMKKWFPEYSAFGDPNHKGIDAQLDILEANKDIMDFDEYNEDEFDDENEHEYIRQQVQIADDWINSQSKQDLFDEQ